MVVSWGKSNTSTEFLNFQNNRATLEINRITHDDLPLHAADLKSLSLILLGTHSLPYQAPEHLQNITLHTKSHHTAATLLNQVVHHMKVVTGGKAGGRAVLRPGRLDHIHDRAAIAVPRPACKNKQEFILEVIN